jgi:hypothetical protein
MDSCLSLFTPEESVGDGWKETDPEQHEAKGARDDQRTLWTALKTLATAWENSSGPDSEPFTCAVRAVRM